MKNQLINQIIKIGNKEECTKLEYQKLLENYDSKSGPKGYYFLQELAETMLGRKIGHFKFNLRLCLKKENLSINDYTSFIKGYHLLEKQTGDFGFGSISISKDLINNLTPVDQDKSVELYNWIATHGGNYYISENSTYAENQKKRAEAAKRRSEILLQDQQKHREAVLKRKEMQEKHSKKSQETRKLYNEYLDKFQKMNDEKLIELFNNEVGNMGWTSSRARFLSAIHSEFIRRGFDYSSIGNAGKLSFKKKIKLKNNVISTTEN